MRYFFYGSEFDSTKAKIVLSPTFTNHMYSGVYDAEGNGALYDLERSESCRPPQS